ncbi:phototropic-responsive NPH3 family protein NPY1 [Aegilops tauschii subsp. strangulata]|uniref:Coleoptile phototropism protein 1 n=2 Tax=Aegilops tauschii subsp. strangulata TaxID=200361 RepID=A0A453KWX2_AEGTS|nr:BTB/POZ domain-containing protein NPY1 [Aegilops tauschii subsp. strangulata]
MKFMKLGSKPDAFQSGGADVRLVVSDLATDVIVHIGEVRFYLHKFPLLSKSSKLQKLVLKATEKGTDDVHIDDLPGGAKGFEICAKFCYGMVVTLSPHNVVAARCAAEYLGMTEDMDKGNLIFKIEVFINSSILRSWKDSIIVLLSTKALLPWSEELKVVGRCIDAIASKTSVDPANVSWSYSYNKKGVACTEIIESAGKTSVAPKDWWVEDLCELDVDLYKRVMVAIKSKGRMSPDLIGEALKAYAVRWLPDSYDALVADDYMRRNQCLVETIIWLLPSDKSSGCSCRFLLKLLKVAILVGSGDHVKEELMRRISFQLHKASVKDLLLPAASPSEGMHDVRLVHNLVQRFVARTALSHNGDFVEKSDEKMIELNFEQESTLALGELVDGYLSEVAADPDLEFSTFVELATAVPEAARPVHDGLYYAVDAYIKEHPDINKADKKKICGLIDVKKLSTDACVHATQNDRLPLRVVVQVLFFQQLRAGSSSVPAPTDGGEHACAKPVQEQSEHCERRIPRHPNKLDKQVTSLSARGEGEDRHVELRGGRNSFKDQVVGRNSFKDQVVGRNSFKDQLGGLLLQSRSRRIFDKLWSSKGHGENGKGSETSGSSQSPPSTAKPTEVKPSPLPPLRNRRYSVS